jgi:large subunit ribosomal protein L6
MSRVGKKPVQIPNGVVVEVSGTTIKIKGPKGELQKKLHENMQIEIKDNTITVVRPSDTQQNRELHGLTRNLIANMIEGVTKGFEKKMEIIGIGYRAQAAKNKITMTLGFSHPVEFLAPPSIEFKMDEAKKNILTISGLDKEIVGEVSAKIRSFKPPEPYKGKGIKYIDEHIQRKAGKAVVTKGGA